MKLSSFKVSFSCFCCLRKYIGGNEHFLTSKLDLIHLQHEVNPVQVNLPEAISRLEFFSNGMRGHEFTTHGLYEKLFPLPH